MTVLPIRTPEPPYYAVIFASRLSGSEGEKYGRLMKILSERAAAMSGFLGEDSVRAEEGLGMTVSYWTDEDAIKAWREDGEHTIARKLGRQSFYQLFELRVAKVERAYSFSK